MIEIQGQYPQNKEAFLKLLEFGREILSICCDLGIAPILSGSLAVFAYTRSPAIHVHDIDLACSEADFPGLRLALDARGISHSLKEWHVLQTLRSDLKVEFDSIEYWMDGLPEGREILALDGIEFSMVSLPALVELYRRGLVDTARYNDQINQTKHRAILEKFSALANLAQSGGHLP